MQNFICKRMKELRHEQKLTQKALAKLMNVDVIKIRKWEKLIESPTLYEMMCLSIHLDAILTYITGDTLVRHLPENIRYGEERKYIAEQEKLLKNKKRK